jgi:hypothetical protein
LLSIPFGETERLKEVLLSSAAHPEGLVKLAFSLHFSRSMLKRKRYSVDNISTLSTGLQYTKLPKLSNCSLSITKYSEWQALWHWLPARYQNNVLELLFASYEHGRSLHYLFLKCAIREPLILFVEYEGGGLIGSYLSKSFVCRLSSKKRDCAYGTGETFIFALKPSIECHMWKPDPDNLGFILCGEQEGIGVGVGPEGYALHIDKDMTKIRSSRSTVFNNAPLVDGVKEILRVEVWSFVGE